MCHVTFIYCAFRKELETWLQEKIKALPSLFVYPTTASGTQQLENKSKPEDNVRHCTVVEEALKKLKTVKGKLSVHIFMVISFYITSFICYICSSSYWAQ